MKKTIKKKKAFTLVELMGVLVIIGVLSAILIPVISKTLKENKQKVYERQLDSIKLAAKNLGSDNVFILPTEENGEILVTLKQLKNMGYMEQSIINPLTKKEFSECTVIKITKVGNIYEYEINMDTRDACQSSSQVIIKSDSKKFIKENSSSSYIITIGNNDNNFGKYNIDTTKIELSGAAKDTAKYSIVGENGIYKLMLIGGTTEGKLSFKLNDGAITDESGNEIESSDVEVTTITVDNTAPTIVFGTDGNSEYSNALSSTITVSDNYENSIDNNSLKYIYSSNISGVEPSKSFTNGTSTDFNQNGYYGNYYLIASACDIAGNCTTSNSNIFLLDAKGPSCGEWNGQNSTWTNSPITLTMVPTDDGSGLKEEYSFSKTYNTEIEVATENLTYTIEDKVGNQTVCSNNVNVYYDKLKPSVAISNSNYGSGWKNAASTKDYVLTLNSEENGSGIASWSYTYDKNKSSWNLYANSAGKTSFDTTPFIDDRNQNVYIKACDNAGNCNDTGESLIKIDTVAPVIGIPNVSCNNSNNASGQARVQLNITENGSGIPVDENKKTPFSGKYSFALITTNVNDLKPWNKEDDYWWHEFGYVSNGNQILYLTDIIVTDIAGNQSSKKTFNCSYSGLYSNSNCVSNTENDCVEQ